jgi:glyoxylase-like metal-dependent hydrolase (beta-lactamase superfamily II)
MKIHRIIVGPIETNCYIVWDESTLEAFVIDPGEEPEKILDFVKKNSLKVSMIISTHGHFDHVNAVPVLKEKLGVPFAVHESDQYLLSDKSASFMRFLGYDAVTIKADRLFREGDKFALGGSLLSGDTLFKGDVGRTDFPRGSSKQIAGSIKEKLFSLPDDTCVFPGHGAFTKIGAEKKGLDLSYLM